MFYYLDLIESWGSGISRIMQELDSQKLYPPDIEASPDQFAITFHKEALIQRLYPGYELSERQWRVLETLYQNEKNQVTNAEYQKIADVSKRTASRELSELSSKGILEQEENRDGKSKPYRLVKHETAKGFKK